MRRTTQKLLADLNRPRPALRYAIDLSQIPLNWHSKFVQLEVFFVQFVELLIFNSF
jgi:hypothetical protein